MTEPTDQEVEAKQRLSSEEVRAFCLQHDHLAVPIRPGVRITWTDTATGEQICSATLKPSNVVQLRALDTLRGV